MTDIRTHSSRRVLAVLLALLGTLAAVRPAAADTISLQWDFNTEPDVTGYRLYVGTQSGIYSQTIDLGNVDTYAFTAAVPGQRYYFAVAARAGSLVSQLSNEVSGISNSPPVLASPGNQSGVVGQAATLALVASDPDGALLTFSASGLPPGLSIAAGTGVISGTPTTAGTFSVTATVSDGVLTAQRTFSWVVAAQNTAPTLVNPGAQSSTTGQQILLQLQGSDANGNTLTYSATGLPPGLSVVANTGLISGSPTTAGTFNVTATVSDGSLTASRSFTWTVAAANVAPTLAVVANQSGTVGQATSLQLQGSDANGNTLTYSATGLPPGLSVAANTGLVSGTPTTAGTFNNVTATVSDGSLTASRSFTWAIAAANVAPTLAVIANQSGTVGQAASLQLQGNDANGNTLTYSATGLPPGLSVAANTGLISGMPTTAGTFNVTATVSDGSLTASRSFTWMIAAANVAPTLAVVANQSGTVGQGVSLQLQGSDANGNTLTYSATGLPPGLSVAANTGLISGTPTTAGTFNNVTATVSDGSLTASRSFTWTIAAANVAPTLAVVANQSGTVGQAASLQLQGSDANGNTLTYSATGLPPGLTVGSSTGLIAGTPTTAGTFNVTATVSDGSLSASRSFTWTIVAANLAPTLAVVANQSGTVGQAASLQLQASDANGNTLTYSATGLPPGLSVAANTGLISGTPTTAGTFNNVTATVSDGSLTASRSFTWTIAAANVAPTLAVVANQSGTVGQATSLQLQGSDANGNMLTYSATGLPLGLSVAANTGLISGTPTTAGTFNNVTATVSDGSLTASRSFTWTIAAANVAPALAVVANQSGTVGQGVSLQLQGSDANGNTLTYSATGLPPGLSVAANAGLISGTPTTAGTFNVTATVSDGSLSASRSFAWAIAAANIAPTLVAVANQSGTVGQAASLQLQGSDANGNTLTYSATGLPPGLSVAANTGLISGTPTTAGTFNNVTATVSDGSLTASRSFTWTIAAANVAPTLAVVANQSGTVGQAASLQLQGSDANGNALTYSATGLPPGMSVAANTGLISGTPTTAGTYNVTATVSDGSLSTSRSFTWTIAAANVAPTLAVVANQSGTVGQAASLQLQGSDANGNTLTYSTTGLPPGLTVGSGTGLIAGTPTAAGTFNVTATVSDGSLSASRSFAWTIASPVVVTPPTPAPPPPSPSEPEPPAVTPPAPVEEPELPAAAPTTSLTSSSAQARPLPSDESSVNYTGTTATARPSPPIAPARASAVRLPGAGAASTTGAISAPVTGPPLFTGTAAIVRSVATAPADETTVYTGTLARTREGGATGALNTMSATTTRAIVRTPTASSIQALVQDPLESALEEPEPPPSVGSVTTGERPRSVVSAPRSLPAVSIETPVASATLATGSPVIFSGVARDYQGVDLSGQIVWTSNIDGRIGTGSLLHKELSAGTHTITASVTDHRGNTRTAQVVLVARR